MKAGGKQLMESLERQLVRLGPGITIPALGVGTWQWGDRFIWGYGHGYSDRDLGEAFEVSVAAGLRFFDTAEVYGGGRSESLLGEFIRATGTPVVVGTKCFPFPWRWGKYALRRALRRSLRRLGLEAVDLYQMHWPFRPVPIRRWMDAMADAVGEGLVKAVGVSNYSVDQMRRAYDALTRRGITLASNQVRLNLLEREPISEGLVAVCRELGMTLIAHTPLAMGVLTGKYTPESPPPGWRSRRYNPRFLAQAIPVIEILRMIAAARGKTCSQVALNWLITRGTLPIPGAKTARQATENAGALGWSLTSEDIELLDQAKFQGGVRHR